MVNSGCQVFPAAMGLPWAAIPLCRDMEAMPVESCFLVQTVAGTHGKTLSVSHPDGGTKKIPVVAKACSGLSGKEVHLVLLCIHCKTGCFSTLVKVFKERRNGQGCRQNRHLLHGQLSENSLSKKRKRVRASAGQYQCCKSAF